MGKISDRSLAGRHMSGAPLRILFSLAALFLFVAPGVRAGSVFMKNGYIIQGPIVEHSDQWIVMGWQNGKVTIYKRFVDKVDFEAGEEKKLVRSDTGAPVEEEVVVPPGAEDELPQNLSELVKAYNLPAALVEGPRHLEGEGHTPAEGGQGGTEGEGQPGATQPPGGTPGVDVTAVPVDPASGHGAPSGEAVVDPAHVQRPVEGDEGLAERVGEQRWGFSIQPPAGWSVAEVEGLITWRGSRDAKGFAPSISVTSLQRGKLAWEDACRTLREDQAAPLQSYERISEDRGEVGGQRAYLVSGRGAHGGAQGVAQGGAKRSVVVRQVLLEEGQRLWVLSSFVSAEEDAKLSSLFDRSLRTFQAVHQE